MTLLLRSAWDSPRTLFWQCTCTRSVLCLFFFFQAEDGIRDSSVTGVQTCALPIFALAELAHRGPGGTRLGLAGDREVPVGERGHLREVGYAQHLAPARERPKLLAHRARRLPPDAAAHPVEGKRGPLRLTAPPSPIGAAHQGQHHPAEPPA